MAHPFFAPADKKTSRVPRYQNGGRVPQFFVLSLPYRGGLEGWMLLCFFLRAEESKSPLLRQGGTGGCEKERHSFITIWLRKTS